MKNGLMMNSALTITSLMRHAESVYGSTEIVSLVGEDQRHRYCFTDAFARTRRLANALKSLGVKPGDRIGTLAWNDHRHFELYYAISGIGAICHTVNPRLYVEQIKYIINHAEDLWLFVDPEFLPLIDQILPKLTSVQGIVVLAEAGIVPTASLPNVYCYETLLAEELDTFDWPDLDENVACSLCYTSGTSGNPKGVLYSHRALILQSFGAALPDSFGLSCRDVILPVVPMFHVNAWGMPYAAAMVGAKLVLPGSKAGDSATIVDLINSEKVTVSLAVPTVWMAVLGNLRGTGRTVKSLDRVVCGGAACPVSIMDEFRDLHQVNVLHCWGMTELSPLGTVNSLKSGMMDLPREELDKVRSKVGRPVYGVEVKIVNDEGKKQPWDGESFGALMVRGPWVVQEYFGGVIAAEKDGWFDTGDIATVDGDGYLAIVDRKKDLIKSGGEWISSNDLENLAVAHPAIAEAAVIGVAHPKWTERPLLVAVKKAGQCVTAEELLEWFDGKVAKWWIPDDVVFVDSLPHTATGKLSKKDVRKQFKDFSLQTRMH